MKKFLLVLSFILCLVFITGCKKNNTLQVQQTSNNPASSSVYFTKGVYLNYSAESKNPSKDFFYVFYDEKSGHTDDGRVGIGLPFACEQMDGIIRFSFGGVDPEGEDILTINSVKNGIITGYFNDGKRLVFEPVKNVNPDNFDAQEYLK